ncbi:MAG TPA: hypothetical protein PKL68_05370 [Actinomycetota bacterium]|nr:hypothetical protein [Actinomycetota bacterium]HNL51365.1 hypothetical protein [Actinomycetota bacterium]HNO15853.1 hypothetical protein [Actinomycetota bacterium]HUM87036.1 hypothetical protein [Actinomycetota bacterium]
MPREGGRAWRVPLIIAVVAMLLAAVAAALGQETVADIIVTVGFAIGVLAVPIWMVGSLRNNTRKEA